MTLLESNTIKICKLEKGHNKELEDSNKATSQNHQYNSLLKLTIIMNHKIVQRLNKRQDHLQMIKGKIILTFIIIRRRRIHNLVNKIL